MKVQSYKELIVWQKSITLVAEVYSITRQMPKLEMFGLVSQMQRSSVAIPSNIAEGFGRRHSKEFLQFLSVSYGSSLELETQIIIAKQQYPEIVYNKAELLLIEVQKMLNSLRGRIQVLSTNHLPLITCK